MRLSLLIFEIFLGMGLLLAGFGFAVGVCVLGVVICSFCGPKFFGWNFGVGGGQFHFRYLGFGFN